MLILDNTKPKAKILEWHPLPDFRTNYERDKYYDKQNTIYVEGMLDNELPGTLCHFIQEQKIYNRSSGKIIRPTCRDADMLFHQHVRDKRKAKRHLNVTKGRGFGLTVQGGALANYFGRFMPGSNIFVTSKEKTAISTIFQKAIMIPFENYDKAYRYPVKNMNDTKNNSYLSFDVKYRDNLSDDEKIATSTIWCEETSESDASASKYSSKGASFGFYDELALHKRKKQLLTSSAPCYRDSLTKEVSGFLLAGGTCEDTLTNEELLEFKELVLESDAWDMDTVFFPFWLGSFLDENGWSDMEKGMEWHKRECDKLANSPDLLKGFLKNYPRTMDDIFELAAGAFFESDVVDTIKLTIKNVEKAKVPQIECKLTVSGNTFEMETSDKIPKKEKAWTVIEEPKPGCEYHMVMDGTAADKETGAVKGSKIAAIIMKKVDLGDLDDWYVPVACLDERPDNMEVTFLRTLTGARWYNIYNGMLGINCEGNAGNASSYYSFLKRQGYEKWAMKQIDFSKKGNINKNKVFQYVGTPLRDWQIRQANVFLRKYAHRFKLLKVLYDFIERANKPDADLRDAFLMYMNSIPETFDDKPKKVKKRREKSILELQYINGQYLYVTKKLENAA